MPSCPCAPADLTRVRIADAVELLRCSAHDLQRWVVDGEPVGREAVLHRLRGVFDDRRGERRSSRLAPPLPAVVRLPEPAAALAGTADEQLTALLRARGIEGSWALA